MGGYGWYIFGAYSCALIFLASQWFFPWRRLKQALRENNHEQDS